MKKEYYYCRRIRIKNWLASRGYKPSFSMPDFKNDKYLVWGYEDSPELRECVEEYYAQAKLS